MSVDLSSILAAVSPAAGFVVTDSFVLMGVVPVGETGAMQLQGLARHDLATLNGEVTAAVVTALYNAGVRGVLAVAVCAERGDTSTLLASARDCAQNAGMEVYGLVHTTSVEQGGRWVDLLSQREGVVIDYRTLVVTADRVVAGNPVLPNRAALVSELAVSSSVADIRRAEREASGHGADDAVLREFTAALTGRGHLGRGFAGKLAVLARQGAFRDRCMHAVTREHTAAALAIMVRAASVLRGGDRATVLSLAAMFAALNGDGARVSVIADRIVAEGQDLPSLAELVLRASQAGLHPTELAAVVGR